MKNTETLLPVGHIMKTTLLRLVLCAAVLCAHTRTVQAAPQEEPVLVGRVSFIKGLVQRYVPESNQWTALVQDAPFGLQDTLYVAEGARAEIILPNSTWIRLGEKTQAQLLRLDAEATEIDIAAGTARIYNKGTSTVVRASTPFGQVVASAQSVIDVYVKDEVAEMVCLRGTAYFIHPAGTSKYDLMPGSGSLVAGKGTVRTAQGTGKDDWLAWNIERDRIWEERHTSSTVSRKYLPEQLHDEAYTLEENGRWEYVSYGGSYYHLWRPVRVHVGWAPFTAGRWSVWYGDLCWMPDEPFGYITHHYGTWVYVESRGCWYWMPPVVVVAIWPAFGHPCAWYPGRVAWIYSDMFLGWIPLLPSEPYYCTRHWGPCAVVTPYISGADHHRHRHHYRHAVCVKKDDLYSVRNYHAAGRSRPLSHIPENSIRSTPVSARDIIRAGGPHEGIALAPDRRTHNVPEKLLGRIQKNLARSQREKRLSAERLLEKVQKIKTADLRPSGVTFSHRPSAGMTGDRMVEKPSFVQNERPKNSPVLLNTPHPDNTPETKSGWGHASSTPVPARSDRPRFFDALHTSPAKPDRNTGAPMLRRFGTDTPFSSGAGNQGINRTGTHPPFQQRSAEPPRILFRPRSR